MRALVTGGAGFIGSHLCDELVSRGVEVCCADNLHLGREGNIAHLLSKSNFTFNKLDVSDRKKLDILFLEKPFDTVFHLAANSNIQLGCSESEVDLRLTFLTTYEILKAMVRHNVKEIFFASSSAVFGNVGKEVLSENYGPLKPVSYYGAAKLASEAYLSVAAQNNGIRTLVLRFPNIVGERCTHGIIHDLIYRLLNDPNRLQVLGDGTQTKPYMYVGDLVSAIFTLFDKAKNHNAVFHVAGEGLTSVKEIVDIIIYEMDLTNVKIDYGITKVGWEGDVSYYNYDTKLLRDFGYHAKYNSTEAVRIAVKRILEELRK